MAVMAAKVEGEVERVQDRGRGSLLVSLAAKRAKGVETFFRYTWSFSNDPF